MPEENYISLTEATRYCNYSQEYLSLRARQGKLKAVKFGRNWVTKKEWLNEYLSNNGKNKLQSTNNKPEHKNFVLGRAHKYGLWFQTKHKVQSTNRLEFLNIFKQPKFRYALRYAIAGILVFCLLSTGIIFVLQQVQDNPEFTEWIGKDAIWSVKDTLTRSNLELFDTVSDTMFGIAEGIEVSSNQIAANIRSIKKPSLPELPELSIPSISISDISIPEIGLRPAQDFKETMSFVADASSKSISVFSQKADNALDELTTIIGGSIVNSTTYMAEVAGETGDDLKYGLNVFQKFSRWYGEQAVIVGKIIKEAPSKITQKIVKTGIVLKQSYQKANNIIEEKLSETYKALTRFWETPEKFVEEVPEEELLPKAKQGMVVIPSTEKDKETKEKIKESFSDEVRVEIKDEESGIIVPIFKEKEGDKYLYIMVPLKD